MAKIAEELVVVKVSQLVKDSSNPQGKITPEFVDSLEAVISELLGADCVVEVIRED
jgi:hypothetical protein